MSHRAYPAKVRTTTATSGLNDYVLNTSPLVGIDERTPKQAVADSSLADGDVVHYSVNDGTQTGDAVFEEGDGVYDDTTNEISRLAADVYDSSSGPGVLISWPGSGQRDVRLHGIALDNTAILDETNVFSENLSIVKTDGTQVVLLVQSDGVANITLLGDVPRFLMNDELGTVDKSTLKFLVTGDEVRVQGVKDDGNTENFRFLEFDLLGGVVEVADNTLHASSADGSVSIGSGVAAISPNILHVVGQTLLAGGSVHVALQDFRVSSGEAGSSFALFVEDSSGNVGIHNASPDVELDVEGQVRADNLEITDGVTAPGTITGLASLYVDTADGDFKIKFGDGTVKTLATDT